MLRPVKSLSQNFLIDDNLIQKFIRAAALTTHDQVLEIGPGKGALTRSILSYRCLLWAIEKDRRLVTYLKEELKETPKFKIEHQDILNFSVESLDSPPKWKVISNLPFQLTSPILGLFLPAHKQIKQCFFIVQKELADRLIAQSGSKLFSHITLFSQFYSDIHELFKVPRTCFYPPPNVECRALQFTLKIPPAIHTELFFEMTKNAFHQKRKMLRKTLPYESSAIERSLEKLGVSPLSRPEELSVEQWIELALNLDFEKFSNH